MPECTGCHQAHPIPVPKDFKPEPASLSMCYGCHHMENFQKCSDAGCHEK
ncbi:cytochrome c3 family protein [Sutterella wadsworthensis]